MYSPTKQEQSELNKIALGIVNDLTPAEIAELAELYKMSPDSAEDCIVEFNKIIEN